MFFTPSCVSWFSSACDSKGFCHYPHLHRTMQKKTVTPLYDAIRMSRLQLTLPLMQVAASHKVASREEEAAPRSQHLSTSDASLVADGVTEIVKRSARHAQDPLAKKGSSTSKPALTEALQADASRVPKLVCCSALCVLPGFLSVLQHSANVCLSVRLSVCCQSHLCMFPYVFACRHFRMFVWL